MVSSAGFGGLMASIVAACAATALGVPLPPANFSRTAGEFWLFLCIDAVCVSLQLVFVNVALRYITGTEVALVLLLQSALSPVAVFFGLGEAPTVWTMVGGAMLLATLMAHEAIGLRARRT